MSERARQGRKRYFPPGLRELWRGLACPPRISFSTPSKLSLCASTERLLLLNVYWFISPSDHSDVAFAGCDFESAFGRSSGQLASRNQSYSCAPSICFLIHSRKRGPYFFCLASPMPKHSPKASRVVGRLLQIDRKVLSCIIT